MTTDHPTPQRPREIERYIASRVRKLADADLIRLLEALRNLTTNTKEQAHV